MPPPGLHGVEIPSSVGGRYLGDDFFLPFWAAAAETGALVFIHPTTRGFGIAALDSYYLWNSVGNPLETAVTAAHIAMAGRAGAVPPAARAAGARRRRAAGAPRPAAPGLRGPAGGGGARTRHGPDWSLRRFYYDTRDPRRRACWPTWSATPGPSRSCSARTGRSTWAATTASPRYAGSAWAARRS